MPVRALGPGGGSFGSVLAGIAWSAGLSIEGVPDNANPAQVINLSLGGNIGQACPAEIDAFFSDLAVAGVVLVAAAGNDNINASMTFPANCSNVVTVGAAGSDGSRAPYSNFGSVVDVMAPGGDTSQTLTIDGDGVTVPARVLSTVLDDGGQPAHGFYQGTSMAAPHVAGVISLMLSAEPDLSVAEIRSRLQYASVPLSAVQCSASSEGDCGAGSLDAQAALTGGEGSLPLRPDPVSVPTYIVAFYCSASGTDPCASFDPGRSVLIAVETTSSRLPYAVADLEPGIYIAAAWQDLNQNDEVDDGEPFGVHPDLIVVSAGQTESGKHIALEAFGLSVAHTEPGASPEPDALFEALEQIMMRR